MRSRPPRRYPAHGRGRQERERPAGFAGTSTVCPRSQTLHAARGTFPARAGGMSRPRPQESDDDHRAPGALAARGPAGAAAEGVPAGDGRDPLPDAGPPEPAADLHLAALRPRPHFPELRKFLAFWAEKIEGRLFSVRVGRAEILSPGTYAHVGGVWQLH